MSNGNSDLAVMDPPQRQLVPVRDDVVNISSLLTMALEKGIDAGSMEKLVMLHERITAKRAEAAFNHAMMDFKARCPSIVRNREAKNKGETMYNYADLSRITQVIDPILCEFGLSYTFDVTVNDKQVETKCTVRHVDGHHESSSFSCPACGTSIMNEAQRVASATTYGRRYSLQFAFGFNTDADDDGRGMGSNPNPKAEADPAAPKVAPRGERGPTLRDQLNEVLKAWAIKFKPKDFSVEAFAEWACGVLHTTNDMTKLSAWTIDSLEVVRQAIAGAK